MSYEKQYGIPKRRPAPTNNAQSPKWAGRGSPLPQLTRTPATNGYPSHRADRPAEEIGVKGVVAEDSVAAPTKPFLSSNITPRSGTRKIRAETTSPTPNGTPSRTPSKSRPVSSVEKLELPIEDARATSGLGLRLSSTGQRSRTGSVISDGPDSYLSSRPDLMEHNNSSRITSPENVPKFFHADEVRASVKPKPALERTLSQGRLAGYIQPKNENLSGVGTPSFSNSATPDEQRPMFFYSNETNDLKSPSSRLANGSSTSRPPLQTIYSAHTRSSPDRAPSPLKEEIIPPKPSVKRASTRRHTRLVSNGGTDLTPSRTASSDTTDVPRSASLKSPKAPFTNTHTRSSSVNSKGPSPPRRSSIGRSEKGGSERARTASLVGANGALPPSIYPPTATQEVHQSQVYSQPQSPTKAPAEGQSKIDQMNELAANARRERKVLDLEISNSSLMAINRTLEREMRKQSAELRRLRRLSRSGHLSFAPSRSASGKISMLSETTDELDDSVDSDDDGEDVEETLSGLSSTSAASRPSSPTARAARSRFQDPKRIELDLAAHRALLLDSQKLNISIKRCLSHSESLLESGKKALAYHAQTPEAENLGPRVLIPYELGDEVYGQGQGLLSPSLHHAMSNPWERSLANVGTLGKRLEMTDYSHWGTPTGEALLRHEDERHTLELPDGITPDATSDVESRAMARELDEMPLDPDVEPKNSDIPIDELSLVPEMKSENANLKPDKQLQSSKTEAQEASLDLDKLLPVPKTRVREAEIDFKKLLPAPPVEARRASSFLSLDGLDEDDFDTAPPSKSSKGDSSLNDFSADLHPDSYAARSERKFMMKVSDPKLGEAGFRGSMQGLGHYLQTFSIFGSPQRS